VKKVDHKKIEFTLVRSRRKTFAVQILEDGSVVVRAPLLATDEQARRLVEDKANWIRRKKARFLRHNSAAEKMGGKLSEEELKELKVRARKLIPGRVEAYAPVVGVSYGRVTVRAQKTRWGSCTTGGNLNFNCLLMLAPAEVLDSVVVHELCHIKEPNHSERFYEEVRRAYPNYDKCSRWLKNNGPALMARLP